MKLNTLFNTSILSLAVLLGTASMVYAQDQRDDNNKPRDEARPEEMKPPQDDAKPKPDAVKPPEKRPGEKMDKPDAKSEKQAEKDQKPAEAKRGGGRIPDDKFRAHFGREHTFTISRPTIVEGRPRFVYSGYTFTVVDTWPAGWAYTDQCYIDFIDGEYFLFDVLHPGVRVAVIVVA